MEGLQSGAEGNNFRPNRWPNPVFHPVANHVAGWTTPANYYSEQDCIFKRDPLELSKAKEFPSFVLESSIVASDLLIVRTDFNAVISLLQSRKYR
jgi:hypothetical protein